MIDPDALDPVEVVAHLHHLGYQNITGPQLDEFMHDLRKLIKYEQKCAGSYGKYYQGSETDGCGGSSYSLNSRGEKIDEMSNLRDECRHSVVTSSSDVCANCKDYAIELLRTTGPRSSGNASESGKKKLSSFSQNNLRPRSSFIRPWQLQPTYKGGAGAGAGSGASLKCDPVNLYHKYKLLWAQQKVPGEKSHSQLRWIIREKMLGQDPHPRPISQASSDYRTRSMSCK